MCSKKPVIAVDGPAAAGKGTLARALAERLGLPYLDTGLLYRAVARRALDRNVPLGDEAALSEQALALTVGDMARPDLRTPEIDAVVSLVARQPAVRAALLERQRSFARERGAVLDGRDIGTVVFPEADVKLFVSASPEVRARRRYQQRSGRICEDPVLLAREVEALEMRDRQDAARKEAPLRPADDAFRIMTDSLNADEVLEKVCQILRARGLIDGIQ